MGVVYKAYDSLMKREVALKTILDIQNRAAMDLFYKEWGILASIVHPNIVEIYDIGELEQDGKPRPYFVMPLLPGRTLDRLIKDSSHRLTVERSVEIICQTCRGLQVAHERGLVHRDLKPSNIFVMVDNSVKIIDFGIVHLVESLSATGLKGTLAYMAPEQVQMKPPSAASDIFALGVVAYETLTRRRPFLGNSETEVAHAILEFIPPPVSEINSAVSPAISQVIHKAMAKQPWHRFASAAEYSETLQKALHNEPIECFDPARVVPRIERSEKAFQQGELQFASDVLSELEAEGHLDPRITMLRRQIDQATRQKAIRQLLESARRCLLDQEYPLALRKIQDALQLDPADADALALKSRVEKERREKKADEWIQLARQHLENYAFSQARLALQNLLELKPTDTAALQLAAEVDRREQDYARLRQEKAQLHEAALSDWHKGQVSSAMVKLERLLNLEHRAPGIDPKTSASFQTLYDQVRSEHDAIRNAYETARTHLASDNVVQAVEICDQYLAKYPGHALFQALKYDAEERQRQKLSAFIAETDCKVENEPDLDRRYSILEEALKTYPGESHFERAIRLVRDKRELVNSIVGRARCHEERGQFNEAADQWKILQTIHSQYPGLDFEIERLMRRRDQQARQEAKSEWVQQIDRHLEAGDYSRAGEAARGALAEFPDDAELSELQKLAALGADRGAAASALLDQGRELCARDRFDEGIEILRKAHQLDERNSVVRAVLIDSLLRQARSVLDSNWKSAEGIVQQIFDLDPENAGAKSLRTLIADHQQDELVSWCTAQARRLQATGGLEGARAVVEQGLASYPNDPRLVQLQATLLRAAHESPQATARRRDLEGLKRLEQHLKSKPDLPPAQRQALADRVRSMAAQYPTDPDIQPLVASIQTVLAAEPGSPVPASPAGEPPPTMVAETLVSAAGALETDAPAAGPAVKPDAPPPVPSPPKPQPWEPAVRGARDFGREAEGAVRHAWSELVPLLRSVTRSRTAMLGAAGFLGVLLAIAAAYGIFRIAHRRIVPPSPLAVAVPVEIETVPPGARIEINGEARGNSPLELGLAPGTYQLKATMDGYQPGIVEVSARGARTPVSLTLQPLPSVLRLLTNLDTATILLDERPAGELQNGELTLNEVANGQHTVKLTAKSGEASFAFAVAPAAIPILTGPVATKDVAAVVVSTFRDAARVECNCGSAKVSMDGNPGTDAGPGELTWSGLAHGTHELALGEGSTAHKIFLETTAAPALNVFLQSDRNVGALVVTTGEDRATIFLNGKPMSVPTENGRLRISNLAPTTYSVRVSKAGFQEVPEQRVEVRKGEESRLDFQLQPTPHMATLIGEGALAGSQVFVDGQAVAEVQADGGFTAKLVSGGHVLELRKDGYTPKRLQKEFSAGEVVRLGAADVALQPVSGALRVAVATPGAVVSLRREGEPAAQARTIAEGLVLLPEGSYLVTATAPKYAEFSATVAVVAGATRTVDVQLKPLAAATQPAAGQAQPSAVRKWEDTAGWAADGKWLVRQGGNFAMFPVTPVAGRLTFTLNLRRGKRLRWVVNCLDDRNYALFEMDKKYFYRSQVANGKTTELAKLLHRGGEGGTYTLMVEVTAGSIAHSIRIDNAWSALDSWSEAGRNLSAGRFGFLIAGRDQFAMADFQYEAR